jgi:hypothetical protein
VESQTRWGDGENRASDSVQACQVCTQKNADHSDVNIKKSFLLNYQWKWFYRAYLQALHVLFHLDLMPFGYDAPDSTLSKYIKGNVF